MANTVNLLADTLDLPLTALCNLPVEAVLLPVLYQLTLIILTARLFAVLFRKFGQPGVVGEITAGLVLGPSVFGHFFPTVFRAIFHPQATGVDPVLFDAVLRWIFTILSQLGLIFLLFLIGLEFDFTHLRARTKSALAISVVGVAVPFVLGALLACAIYSWIEPNPLADSAIGKLGFVLFMGTALSITAVPVLGRIMLELGIQHTRLGAITIASAAVNDAIGWLLLASVAAIVGGNFSWTNTLRIIGLMILFALTMLFFARPALALWAQSAMHRGSGKLAVTDLTVLLACILLCAIATSLIGIFAVFGAFFLGAILSGQTELREAALIRLRDFVTMFFLPIFFTYTGLRTDIGSLQTWQLWLICGVVFFTAVLGKFGGCGLAAWLSGHTARESACIGAMMNTRGLMELIVVNVGYELHVIPQSIYCMLVLMALATNLITTPLLVRLSRGTELEPCVQQAGFLPRRKAEHLAFEQSK